MSQVLEQVDYSPLRIGANKKQVAEWLCYGSVYVDGRRQRQDVELQPGQIVRVHTRRKQFPVAGNLRLRERIVFDHEEFLVVDKPAGLPTHPTLDNFLDNTKVRLENELGCQLFTTHRLDVSTEGLLILAKNNRAQTIFNRAFAQRRVKKFYRSLNEGPVSPESTLTTWIPKDEFREW